MKEGLYYKKLKNKIIQCQLCPRFCTIKTEDRGDCKVRQNQNGKLISLVYSKPCSVAIDPIEKKPLFHFLPGSMVYSIGTAGCNLHCLFCQNWITSQAKPEEIPAEYLEPAKVVEEAYTYGCKIIAYTYNEPVVFYEYVLDSANLAKEKGIKNVIVSNGFINQEPLEEWCKYLNGVNIDFKAFDDKFYREITSAWLKPVLETIKTLKKKKVWIELTNLIIPGLNDKPEKIKKLCKWIIDNVGKDVPLHFSAFYPTYKMMNIAPTTAETLLKAYEIAKKAGINYVYVGNIATPKGNNTYCPKCSKLLIERAWFEVTQNNLKDGKCRYCNEKIPGVWE